MQEITNAQILVGSRPGNDFPKDLSLFRTVRTTLNFDKIPNDCVVLKTLFISVDPVMRVWLSGAKTYLPSLEINTPMYAFGVAKIIKSTSEDYKVGDLVVTNTKMQQYFLVNLNEGTTILNKIDNTEGISPHHYLNTLGNNGLTAFYGLFGICQIKPGQTVVISTAAGATGLIACQLAKLHGCRVVALTGGDDKKKFLLETVKVDYCINYRTLVQDGPEKNPDKTFIELIKELKKACPKGVHAYFDNVGEYMLDAVLAVLRDFGKVALCGALASYKDYKSRAGIKNYNVIISKRLFVKGFVFVEALEMVDEFKAKMTGYLKENKIIIKEEILEGLEQAPLGLQRLFLGDNIGKILIKVDVDGPRPKL